MLEVVYYVAASLDGYIATPDGGVEWLAPFTTPGEDHGYADFFASVDSLLLGSHTFEQSLSFGGWPYGTKPCWVFSTRDLAVERPEVVVTAHPPREVVAQMEARGHRRAWLVGGAKLAASLRAEGLITEYIVSVIPVILGAGIPLFGSQDASAAQPEALRLIESQRFDSGIVQLHYRSVPRPS